MCTAAAGTPRYTGDVDGWRLVTFVPGLIPLSCAG